MKKGSRQRQSLFRRIPFPTEGELVGRITVVQEDRFRLEDGDGRGYLLILGRRSGVSLADLDAWQRGSVRVRVHYEGAPDLGAVAEQIRTLGIV